MPAHVLYGLLTLFTLACTTTMFVISLAVISPRKQQKRPIRVPLTIGLCVGAVGLAAAVVNFVIAF